MRIPPLAQGPSFAQGLLTLCKPLTVGLNEYFFVNQQFSADEVSILIPSRTGSGDPVHAVDRRSQRIDLEDY